MHKRHILQLPARIGERPELFLDLSMKAIEDAVNCGTENIILALEVEIDRSVGDTGPCRDRTDRRAEVPAFGDYLHGSIKNTLIFVSATWESRWTGRSPGPVCVATLFALQCSLEPETSSAATLKKLLVFAKMKCRCVQVRLSHQCETTVVQPLRPEVLA